MSRKDIDISLYKNSARHYRIAITVPTFKRPQSLRNLTDHLEPQIKNLYERKNNPLTIKLFIAENDLSAREGAAIVAAIGKNFPCEVTCLYESRKGVSIVRNTLTEAALDWKADFILFIDDDEWPCEQWIEKMVDTADTFTADIVSAPVIPSYEGTPPAWITQGRFFEDDDYETGALPDIKRTSNLLIRSSWLNDRQIFRRGNWFSERLGHYGGEDSMLIETLIKQGAKHVWCHEATVKENIPKQRQTVAYLANRAYRFGNIGMLYRSMLRPGMVSGMVRIGKTSYLIARWAILSGRYLGSNERRKRHFIELQTVLGRLNAHRGSYHEHY